MSELQEDDEYIIIPDPDNSGYDGDFESDDEDSEPEVPVPNVSYKSVFHNYTEKQKKLEPNHEFTACIIILCTKTIVRLSFRHK